MMKTILVILFAITSSSALAQRHVPGGGPVGSPGNPGTHRPPIGHPGGGPRGPAYPYPPRHYPAPSYPSPSYPNPYPNYPSPTYPNPNNYPVGPCVINSQFSGNAQYYTVYDGRGNYVSASYDYYQALRTAESYDQMGFCRGIRNNTSYPTPYPQPQPQTYCTVMSGQDAYGRQFFRVLDRAGRIIYTSSDYNQALQISRVDQRCFQYN